jgi:DNA ligase (NAD+)
MEQCNCSAGDGGENFTAENQKKSAAAGEGRRKAAAEELAELDGAIADHNRRYYRDAAPTIGDGAYDALRRKREELLRRYPALEAVAAPSAVGDDRLEKFRKRAHLRPMLSLNNSYNEEELRRFVERVERVAGGTVTFAVEPKIDGAALTLVFQSGRLHYALSRGSGAEGDDVTANVGTIEGLPHAIPMEHGVLEVRGEVHVTGKDFAELNGAREEEGLEPFANARNLAAGSLKLLDPRKARERRLRFLAYEIGEGDGKFSTHGEVLETLRAWGFPTNDFRLTSGWEEIWQAILHYDRQQQGYDFDTDGAVVKVNERELRNRLGFQATAPRWAIAYKFSPERAETVLEGIRLQVGRSGVVTPVAELRPVLLAGTTIRSATLHNADEIARKDLRIGDTVVLERAGEVIPAVVAVSLCKRPPDAQPYRYPDCCPACGGALVRIGGEVAYRCLNPDCPPQIARRLLHFSSKSALDIESLGPQRVEQLLEADLLRHFTDIFRLKLEPLLTLPRMGEKSALRLLEGIAEAKNRPLWRLIHGLGIPHVGAETAKELAQRWPSLHGLTACSAEELEDCEGIGAVVAASIHKFFQDKHNRQLIGELAELGLRVEEERGDFAAAVAVADNPFAGKTFAITGTFSFAGREDLRQAVEARGGAVRTALSGKVDVLLAGERPGSKVGEAERLAIPTVGEDTLRRWLGQ